MKNLFKLVLMLSLALSGAFCYAHGEARTGNENEKEGHKVPIELKESTGSVGGLDRSNSLNTFINGHVLSITFTENLGEVAIEITTATSGTVEYHWLQTPNGLHTYLSQTGDYVVTFTLSNGDEYYGEFTVTD